MIEKFCSCGSNKIWKSRTKEHGYLCKVCWNKRTRFTADGDGLIHPVATNKDEVLNYLFLYGSVAYDLKAITTPKRNAKIKVVSDKQAKRLATYRVVRDSYMAVHPVCEYPYCREPSKDLHHGAGRCGDLLTNVTYFKALCRLHHRVVEAFPTKAQDLGLSFKRLNK